MKDILRSIMQKWFTLWALTIIVFLMPIVTYADYPSALSSMKRVVASTSEQEAKFSSNILVSGGGVYVPRYKDQKITAAEKAEPYIVNVYVYNYSISGSLSPYPSDINYTVSFELTDRRGTPKTAAQVGERSVTIYDENGNSITLDASNLSSKPNDDPPDAICRQQLVYDVSETDSDGFILEYDGDWNLTADEDICVKMTAQPVGDYQDLKTLEAFIGLKNMVSTGSSGWQAYLSEHQDETASDTPEDYDGYNLVIRGSGTATVTIQWDPSCVEINPNFYTADGIYKYPEISGVSGDTWKSITISADATAYRNRYNIQVYKKAPLANWDFFNAVSTDDQLTITIGYQ